MNAGGRHKAVEFVLKMLKREPLCLPVVIVAKAWRDSLLVERAKLEVLPLSALIELIVIHAMQDANIRSIRAGFMAFLEALVHYERLQVTWVRVNWFDAVDILPSIRAAAPPTILDPADPTNNVARAVSEWAVVAELARKELSKLRSSWIDTTRGFHIK